MFRVLPITSHGLAWFTLPDVTPDNPLLRPPVDSSDHYSVNLLSALFASYVLMLLLLSYSGILAASEGISVILSALAN